MFHQVLTSLLLMGVCLTMVLLVIMPQAALVAEPTPRPSQAPLPRVLQAIDPDLPEIRLQQGSVDRWDNEGGASGLRPRQRPLGLRSRTRSAAVLEAEDAATQQEIPRNNGPAPGVGLLNGPPSGGISERSGRSLRSFSALPSTAGPEGAHSKATSVVGERRPCS